MKNYLVHIFLDIIIPAMIRPTFERLGYVITKKIFKDNNKHTIGF